MTGCPFTRKPDLCARRQMYTTPAPSDCRACDFFGRKAGSGPEAAQPAVEKPAGIIPRKIPDRIPGPGKEGNVDQGKVKESIVRVLGRKGPMTSSSLKLYAAKRETREDFLAAINALAGEGKVVTTAGAQPGSLRVALPGAAATPSPTASNDATVPPKRQRKVNQRQSDRSPAPATPPIKTRARKERPVSAPRKPLGVRIFGLGPNGGPVATVIADLEARRAVALDQVEKIDVAIAGLRALM